MLTTSFFDSTDDSDARVRTFLELTLAGKCGIDVTIFFLLYVETSLPDDADCENVPWLKAAEVGF